MPQPTKHATLICIILTVVLILGVILGLTKHNPLITALFLLPIVIYEVYRTEGKSTKWASWVMLFVIVAEAVFIFFKINFDLASFLGISGKNVAGYYVPLGDIKIVFPAIMAVLSLILFVKTYGKYTKWLAILIFIGAVVIVYMIDPLIFKTILKSGIDEGLNQIR